MKVSSEHAKEAAGVATGALDKTIAVRLIGHAKVVLNAGKSDEIFDSCLYEILSIVGVQGFGDAKNGEGV